ASVGARQRRRGDREDIMMGANLQRHVLQPIERLHWESRAVYRRIKRREETHIVTGCNQVFRERAGYVGEPTGLGQWRHLRGEQANARIHARLPRAIMSPAPASFISS